MLFSIVNDGLITAKGYGTAVITATAEGGAKATCTVTVDPAVNQLRAGFWLGHQHNQHREIPDIFRWCSVWKAPYQVVFTLSSDELN